MGNANQQRNVLYAEPLQEHTISSPIRIAHIMGKMVGGGVESVVMNYYRHIDKSQVQFDLLIDEDSALVPYEEVEALGGRIIKVPPYQQLPRYIQTLKALFKQEQWPIVHSHINTLSVFPLYAAKCAGVPVRIAHSHSTGGKGEYAKNTIKKLLKTQANRYPTHHFACSEYAGKWLFGKDVKFEVIRNAIEIDKFRFSESARRQIRTTWGISEDALVIGHVGRLSFQKNQIFLIDVLSECRKQGLNAWLVLIGEGSDRQKIENHAAKQNVSDHLILAGQMDAAKAYSGFDVFCFPSLYEGLGMAVIEAQVSGLPCLVSSYVPYEVDVAGKINFLPIDDSEVWVQVLSQVEIGQRYEIDPQGFADCDIKVAVGALLDFYKKYFANRR